MGSTVDQSTLPSPWEVPLSPIVAQSSCSAVSISMALIDELKAMLTKMVAVEVKSAEVPAELAPLPSLDALHSPSPSFPSPRKAIFKRRCHTSLR
jgi:hypothetical protein